MATRRAGTTSPVRVPSCATLLVAGLWSLGCTPTASNAHVSTAPAESSAPKVASAAAPPVASTTPPASATLRRAVTVPSGESLSSVYGAPMKNLENLPWTALPLATLAPTMITRPPEPATVFGWTMTGEGERRLVLLGPVVGHYFSDELRVESFARKEGRSAHRSVGIVTTWELHEGTQGSVPCPRALSLHDATGALIAFDVLPSRVEARELDLVPGHTLLELRADQNTNEGGPERWWLVDVDEGRFRELASAQLGVGWTHPPPGSVEVTYGAAPRVLIREPEEELTYCSARAKCAGTERVLEWDAARAELVERSRKKVHLTDKPGPPASAVKS